MANPGKLANLTEFPDAVNNGENGKVKVSLMAFGKGRIIENNGISIEDAESFDSAQHIKWISVVGLKNPEAIGQIGESFAIHPLVIEDILNVTQRPKQEDFGKYTFIVMKLLSTHNGNRNVEVEQISFILTKKFLISF